MSKAPGYRKPRPLCVKCAAGDHKATAHTQLGCLYEMPSGYICDCDHGATVAFRSPMNDGKRVEMCIDPKTAKRRAA